MAHGLTAIYRRRFSAGDVSRWPDTHFPGCTAALRAPDHVPHADQPFCPVVRKSANNCGDWPDNAVLPVMKMRRVRRYPRQAERGCHPRTGIRQKGQGPRNEGDEKGETLKLRLIGALLLVAVNIVVVGLLTTSPAAAQPNWCGWTPANNSNILAWIYTGPVNIRTGQGIQCDSIAMAQQNDVVFLHCQVINGAGERWFYLWDSANSKTGWVKAGAVARPWDPVTC